MSSLTTTTGDIEEASVGDESSKNQPQHGAESGTPTTEGTSTTFDTVDSFQDVAHIETAFSWLHRITEPKMRNFSAFLSNALVERNSQRQDKIAAIKGSPILAGMFFLLFTYVTLNMSTLLLHSYQSFTIYEMSCLICGLLLIKIFSLARLRRFVLNQIVSRQRTNAMPMADGLTVISASILAYGISDTGSWICVAFLLVRFMIRECAFSINVLILIETLVELAITAFSLLYCVVSHIVSDNLARQISAPLIYKR